jgi:hypothetical protein
VTPSRSSTAPRARYRASGCVAAWPVIQPGS